jgi:hypothetical protein
MFHNCLVILHSTARYLQRDNVQELRKVGILERKWEKGNHVMSKKRRRSKKKGDATAPHAECRTIGKSSSCDSAVHRKAPVLVRLCPYDLRDGRHVGADECALVVSCPLARCARAPCPACWSYAQIACLAARRYGTEHYGAHGVGAQGVGAQSADRANSSAVAGGRRVGAAHRVVGLVKWCDLKGDQRHGFLTDSLALCVPVVVDVQCDTAVSFLAEHAGLVFVLEEAGSVRLSVFSLFAFGTVAEEEGE